MSEGKRYRHFTDEDFESLTHDEAMRKINDFVDKANADIASADSDNRLLGEALQHKFQAVESNFAIMFCPRDRMPTQHQMGILGRLAAECEVQLVFAPDDYRMEDATPEVLKRLGLRKEERPRTESTNACTCGKTPHTPSCDLMYYGKGR